MAIYRLDIKTIGRTANRTATGAAAYRAGERIRDERSGELFNYSRRKDVQHTEIMLPSKLDGANVDWARDRAKLWNAAEIAEKRKDSRVAREIQVALPHELTDSQRLTLARTFSREVADHYGVAVDLAVHEPRAGSNSRNYHAHLLMTTREVTEKGLGPKTGMDMHIRERAERALPSMQQEYRAVRERWATLTNEALREAGVEARVDHRTLEAQGIKREPRPHLPWAAYQMEQRGLRSEVAEYIREEHRARVQARLERTTERTGTKQKSVSPPPPGAGKTNLEEIRRQAREAWLRLRPKEAESTPTVRDRAHDNGRDGMGKDDGQTPHGPEEDFSR